ncbi:MAG: hypothetical protein IPH39_00795 [Sulfuritalea sp.]|nr:hypothetical protein [Sulfuritalea sp.]
MSSKSTCQRNVSNIGSFIDILLGSVDQANMYKNCEFVNTSMGSCSKNMLLATHFYEVSMAATHRPGKSRRWRDGGIGEINGVFRFFGGASSKPNQEIFLAKVSVTH